MELIQLERFKKVVELENITLAAEQLYISQPGLSKTIARLEEELNVKLFIRGNNSITLTEAGKALSFYADKVLAETRSLKENMEIFSAKTHKIKFCATSYNIIRYLMPMFNEAYPDVEFFTDIIEQNKIEDCLINNEYDIAMSYKPIENNSNIFNMPIYEDRLTVIVPKTHPLASKKTLRIKDLANQDVLRVTNTDFLSEHLNNMLKTNNVLINFHYVDDPILCRELIKNSNYLSFTSTLAQDLFVEPSDKKILIPISDSEAILTCYIVYNKSSERKVAIFKKFIHENYKKIMGG